MMKIVTEKLTRDELKQMAADTFGDLVKAVVDVDRELVALDAELHSDLEALLIENGSHQKSLWGINLYPEMRGDKFIEFDSLINIRPSQKNMSRDVTNQRTRQKIIDIITKRIER